MCLELHWLIILAVWDVPESAKWFAFSTNYASVPVSSVLYGWANTILRHNVKERALTLILLTAIATSTNAWVPLLVFPTVQAPRFPKGYPYAATNVVCLVVMTQMVGILYNREEYACLSLLIDRPMFLSGRDTLLRSKLNPRATRRSWGSEESPTRLTVENKAVKAIPNEVV